MHHHKETGFARYEKGAVKEAVHQAYEEAKAKDAEQKRWHREYEINEEHSRAVWWYEHFWRWVPFSRRTPPEKAAMPDTFYGHVDHCTRRQLEELLHLIATCDDTHILLSPEALRLCDLDGGEECWL